MRTAAGKDAEAAAMVVWIEKRGRFVPVVRGISPPLQIPTLEEFGTMRDRSKVMGLDPDDPVASDYGTVCRLVNEHNANRGRIPFIQFQLPPDWNAMSDVALCILEGDAAQSLLPRTGLVGEGTMMTVDASGVETTCRYLTFRGQAPIPPFWTGLLTVEAALLLRDRPIPGPAEVRDIVSRMLGGDGGSSTEQFLERATNVHGRTYRLLNAAVHGTLTPTLELVWDPRALVDFVLSQVIAPVLPLPPEGPSREELKGVVARLCLRARLSDADYRNVLRRALGRPKPATFNL